MRATWDWRKRRLIIFFNRENESNPRTIVDCPSRIISWNLTVGKFEESTVN